MVGAIQILIFIVQRPTVSYLLFSFVPTDLMRVFCFSNYKIWNRFDSVVAYCHCVRCGAIPLDP